MNRLFVKIVAALVISLPLLAVPALATTMIRGQCIDIDSKLPLASTTVYVDIANTRYSVDADDKGNFAIPLNLMQPVNASLSAEYNLYMAKTAPLTLNPDEELAVTIYMRKIVYDYLLNIYDYKTLKPIDPHQVTFANISDNRLFNISINGNTLLIGFNTTTKSEGILVLKSTTYAPAAVKINKNSKNKELSAYLHPLSKEKMYGVITNKNGDALVDAKVILEMTGGDPGSVPKRYYAYTNYAGLYIMEYVLPGKYKCIVSKKGYAAKLFGIIIQPDTVVEHNVELNNTN